MESFESLKRTHAQKLEKFLIANSKIKEVKEMLPVLLPYTLFRYIIKIDGNIAEFIEWDPEYATLNAVIGTNTQFAYIDSWRIESSPQKFRTEEIWDHIFHILDEAVLHIDMGKPSELNAYKE